MKILIVSGFLGAGKTTFIKEMLKKTKRDLVVMENEYGEVGIDGGLIKEDKDINIWELTEGCICCSTKSDFAASVLTIANTLDPEFLIVEPTGVGMLSNVIKNISAISYERIALLRPITIIDAYSFDRYMNEYRDIFTDQISSAGLIIFSKGDFSTERENERLLKAVKEINPEAEILMEHYSLKDMAWWEEVLSTDIKGGRLSALPVSAPDLDSFGMSRVRLQSLPALVNFLENIIRGKYGNICRAKGVLSVGDSDIQRASASPPAPLRFDIASDRYSITGCDKAAETKAVFIGRNIDKNALRKLLLADFKRQMKMKA